MLGSERGRQFIFAHFGGVATTSTPAIMLSMRFSGFLRKFVGANSHLILSDRRRDAYHLESRTVYQSISTWSLKDRGAVMQQFATLVSRRHKKALVVDDSAVCRTLHSLALTSMGFIVTTASDGLAGVAAAQLEDFDVITLDVRMPFMNGVECTRQIRLMETRGTARATIIGISSSDCEQECFNAGMDAFTKKPLNRAFLQAVLRQSPAHLRT